MQIKKADGYSGALKLQHLALSHLGHRSRQRCGGSMATGLAREQDGTREAEVARQYRDRIAVHAMRCRSAAPLVAIIDHVVVKQATEVDQLADTHQLVLRGDPDSHRTQRSERRAKPLASGIHEVASHGRDSSDIAVDETTESPLCLTEIRGDEAECLGWPADAAQWRASAQPDRLSAASLSTRKGDRGGCRTHGTPVMGESSIPA